MIKSTKQRLLLTIKVTFLCLGLSLLPTNKGLAQECVNSEIDSYIKNSHNTEEWFSTIASAKKCGLSGVSVLVAALQQEDKAVRLSAISALGSMGKEAQVALPSLSESLQDRDEKVRSSAAFALNKITASAKSQVNTISNTNLDEAILDLETALKVLKVSKAKVSNKLIAFVRPPLNIFQAEQKYSVFESTLQRNWQYQLIVSAGIYIISLSSLWLVTVWLRPLWVLRINNTLKHYTDFTSPTWLGSVKVPLRYLLLVSFFHHHPKVLDAWVDAHTDKVREGFEKKANFRQQHNTPITIIPDSSKVASLSTADNFTVPDYAKAIAWECLKQNYQPSPIKRQVALAVIATLNQNYSAETQLQHLEKHLGLIKTISPAQDICFVRPMLAEYLAASYLVKHFSDNEIKWRKFLAQADAMPNQEAIKGFLLAVCDCCLSLSDTADIPNFVLEELSRRTALNTALDLRQ